MSKLSDFFPAGDTEVTYEVLEVSGTWTKRPDAKFVMVECVSSGTAGVNGKVYTGSSTGYANSGSPGKVSRHTFSADELPASIECVVGGYNTREFIFTKSSLGVFPLEYLVSEGPASLSSEPLRLSRARDGGWGGAIEPNNGTPMFIWGGQAAETPQYPALPYGEVVPNGQAGNGLDGNPRQGGSGGGSGKYGGDGGDGGKGGGPGGGGGAGTTTAGKGGRGGPGEIRIWQW